MRYLNVALAALTLGWSSMGSAATADVSLNDNAARFGYSSYVGSVEGGRSQFEAGLLFNNDGGNALHAGLHVVDLVGAKTPGLQVAIGGRLYYAEADKGSKGTINGGAFALGGELQFHPAQAERLGLAINYHYAPSVVSWNVDNLSEAGVRIEYTLVKNARVYLGYRNLQIKEEDTGRGYKVDKAGHVGLSLDF